MFSMAKRVFSKRFSYWDFFNKYSKDYAECKLCPKASSERLVRLPKDLSTIYLSNHMKSVYNEKFLQIEQKRSNKKHKMAEKLKEEQERAKRSFGTAKKSIHL
jgi:hypothetical protein